MLDSCQVNKKVPRFKNLSNARNPGNPERDEVTTIHMHGLSGIDDFHATRGPGKD